MALVPAICTQCGARIEVDGTHDTGICKYCGTAFVIEKAENNDNVNPIVQNGGNMSNIVEQSNKHIMMARKYKYSGDMEMAERFYSLALEGQPDNWEANFYTTYYSGMRAKRDEIVGKAIQMQSCIVVSIDLLRERAPADEVIVCLREMQRRLSELSYVLFHLYRSYYYKNSKYSDVCREYNYVVRAIVGMLYTFGDKLEVHFFSSRKIMEVAVNSWKYALSVRKGHALDHPIYYNSGNGDSKKSIKAEIEHYARKIRVLDPAYKAPKAKGCYIATCVYGSYDCPQVWTLRRFRDYTLNETWYGRVFIKCYYAISPILVRWFGHRKWFRILWKKFLDGMVKKLNYRGIENTRYYDTQ